MLVKVIQGNPIQILVETIGGKCGRGASVSACADLNNQLLSCWVDPHIASKKHLHHVGQQYFWIKLTCATITNPTGLEKAPVSQWLVTLLHICGVIPTLHLPISVETLRQYRQKLCWATMSPRRAPMSPHRVPISPDMGVYQIGKITHFWKINIFAKTVEFVIYVQNLWICAVNKEILKTVINIRARF